MFVTQIQRFLAHGWHGLVVALSLFIAAPVLAQYTSDIDIYGAAAASNDPPNVLIILDNTANWNSAFTNEIKALVDTFNGLPTNKFRVGIMMFTESGGANSGDDGGYVRAALRNMDASYRTKMAALLNSLDVVNDKTNGGKSGKTMAEAYAYFAGLTPQTGNNKSKTDHTGNVSGTAASNLIYLTLGNALTSKTGTVYNSPITSGCQRNYVIYISNGSPSDNSSDNSTASSRLSAAYAAISKTRPADISLPGVGTLSDNAVDEWARFMNTSSQNINTFTLDIDRKSTGQGPDWTKLLKSMANVGGGQYYDIDSTAGGGSEISSALSDIFNQIQAVDSVFASASLPVSVNARGTYLNQIFMGMFRPDGSANPRWKGNLKQYKFGYDVATDSIFLSDAANNPAVSGATGFISPSAQSYWTTPSTFWINDQIGTPPTSSDSPDGEVVEKGGVAQRIRTTFATSQATRKVFTCISCAKGTVLSSNPVAQFVTSNTAITAATLGVATNTDKNTLVDWVRGTDNTGDEMGPGGTTTVRPSVHGDVLHSRPAVVNYGGTTGVVVFYGSNDGTLRAVSGNQTGTGAGSEMWAFIPEENLSKLNRLRINSPNIRISTTVVSLINPPTPRDYFVDGPIGVYQKATVASGVQTNEKVYIYVGMRRGGRTLYAFDVTNPTTPTLMWKKTQSDIPVLGQTWSEPKLAKVKGNTNPVLIFGAGYDAAAEDTATPGTTTMGNAILVLDAVDGTLLKSFATTRSVASDVALVDTDFDGLVDRAYAVDVGGSVYRIDLENAAGDGAASGWGSYKLASLTGSGTRKFFYPPDVVVTPGFIGLMMGTGDREKPLATTSSDSFFTLKDARIAKGAPATAPTVIVPTDLGLVGSAENMDKGCYLPMSIAGEKIVNAPATVGGVTYFSTNQPTVTSGSCSANLGQAKTYSAPLFCKTAVATILKGGGLPPSPVTGIVTVSYLDPITGKLADKQVPFIIGAPNSKGSGIEASKVTPNISPVRTRRYWYIDNPR